MIEPMIGRLAGCFVFAGLIGAMLVAVSEPQTAARDVVAAAEVQHRVEASIISRP